MTASLYLARADIAYGEARVHGKQKIAIYEKQRTDNIEKAINTAPYYAPAHLIKGEALVYQAQFDSFFGDKRSAESKKTKAVESYKRAVFFGDEEVRRRANQALQSIQ